MPTATASRAVTCPACGRDLPLPPGAGAGTRIACPWCAGLTLRLHLEGDRLVAVEVPYAYCPACRRDIEVPEGARPGDALTCCGRAYRLTHEFGAWALQGIDDHGERGRPA